MGAKCEIYMCKVLTLLLIQLESGIRYLDKRIELKDENKIYILLMNLRNDI